ncbi:MAG TPA: terminase large subunit, partial [Clostridia bacterium]|nr:terminase large subunit [Clostridia bacterium]
REREKRDGVPFSRWVKAGLIHATEGNAVDYGAVEARILELTGEYDVELLGVDPWNSQMLTQRLMQAGLEVLEVPQTFGGMSPAMKDMERLLLRGDMTHEKNDVARWCFGNVRNAVDGNENLKPMKNRSPDRIDITVAWIIAVAAARSRMSMEQNVYETRGPRFISFG